MSSRSALIVGLGNPGARYAETRHNAGFWFVDALAHGAGGQFKAQVRYHGEVCKIELAGQECWLLKPTTYMNRSGQAITALASYYKIPVDGVLVAHDELDLAPGVARLKQGGGHGGHNGLRSTIEHLGGNGFTRLRLGIGHPGHRDLVTDYVLTKPAQNDRGAIEAAIEVAVAVMPEWVGGDLQRAMHRLHSSGQ